MMPSTTIYTNGIGPWRISLAVKNTPGEMCGASPDDDADIGLLGVH